MLGSLAQYVDNVWCKISAARWSAVRGIPSLRRAPMECRRQFTGNLWPWRRQASLVWASKRCQKLRVPDLDIVAVIGKVQVRNRHVGRKTPHRRWDQPQRIELGDHVDSRPRALGVYDGPLIDQQEGAVPRPAGIAGGVPAYKPWIGRASRWRASPRSRCSASPEKGGSPRPRTGSS